MSTRSGFRSGFFFSSLLLASAALLLLPSRAAAQSASVSGQVTDQANAVISAAQVEISNADTGVSQTTKSNDDGFYSIAGLLPGRYSLTVSKQQFKTVSVVGSLVMLWKATLQNSECSFHRWR